MFFQHLWRIETSVGWIELELDEEGEPLTDEEEIWETDCILFRLKYAIKNRDPRVTTAIIEVYSEFHPERFPPGIVPTSISPHAIDDLRPEMIDFLEDEVEAGHIRLYDDDIVMSKVDRTEKVKHTPQTIVPERTTFIGAKVRDQDGLPVANTRVQFELPDGDIKVVRTNSEGVARVEGFAKDGMAKVTLLDFKVPVEGGQSRKKLQRSRPLSSPLPQTRALPTPWS